MKHLVKRAGHIEEFDPRKIYASVYSACMSVRMTVKEAEMMADATCTAAITWIKTKEKVSSNEIAQFVSRELQEYNEDASYIYLSHRDIS